jgi:solute carrier family 25 phosphate transporter 3
MTKQVSFDLLATYLFAWAAQPHDNIPTSPLPTEQVKFLCTTTSAFMASILACISSQPGDVLLTKIYKERHSLISSSPCGMLNAMTLVKTVYREEGLGGLFAGLSARLAHVATIVTLQLLVYDYLKQLLGLAATVSDC